MQAKDIMTEDPACAIPETPLKEVAQMMMDFDCGEIPVVNNFYENIPVGVITDRDIVCRAIAKGINPIELGTYEVMTTPVVIVNRETSLAECCRIMEENKIRRMPVIDADGMVCGIVSLADIANRGTSQIAGEIVQEVSISTANASTVDKYL